MPLEKRSRGRPLKPGGPDPAILVKFPRAQLDALDAYAEANGISRSDAIRAACDALLGLKSRERRKAKPAS